MVGEVWGKGDIDGGMLEADSAQYVAGYVTKKLTGVHDVRLEGRYPEFSRMSLRPGIGAAYVGRIAETIRRTSNLAELMGDVPSTLRHGRKQMPLGRYLRRRLRLALGRDEKCPQEVQDAYQEEVQALRGIAEAATSHPTMARFRKEVLRNLIMDEAMGVKWKAEYQLGNEKRRKL